VTASSESLRIIYDLTGYTATTAENVTFELDLQRTSARLGSNGNANDISSGTLLLESEKRDEFRYNMDGTQDHMGFLKSRNFVRNDIKLNYSYRDDHLLVSFFMGIPAYFKGDKVNGQRVGKAKSTMKDDGRKRKGAWGKTQKYWKFAIRKLYVYIPYGRTSGETEANTDLRTNTGLNIEQIIFSYPGWDKEYDLINDLGYSFKYRSPFLVAELTEAHQDNNDFYEPGAEYEDEFTEKIMDLFGDETDQGKEFGRYPCTITLVTSTYGDIEGEHNNTLHYTQLKFNATMKSIGHEREAEDEEED
jgi:hypothetical protein